MLQAGDTKKLSAQPRLAKPLPTNGREAEIAAKHRQRLGGWGEEQAAAYLSDRGYELLDRNVRTPYGEIDLILKNAGIIIFVEVKTRSSARFGYPEQSVTRRKIKHLLASAQFYLQNHLEMTPDWQVDVLAVEKIPDQETPTITHFENVLSELS